MSGEKLREVDPGAAWFLEFIAATDDETPAPKPVVTEDGRVYSHGASAADVLDAIGAWNDTRAVGLPDVVDALTPSPDEAVLIVAAALADPPPEGLATRLEAAVQEAARESVWTDPPWRPAT